MPVVVTQFYKAVQSLGVEEPVQVCDIVFNEFDTDGSGAVDCEHLRSTRNHAPRLLPCIPSAQPCVVYIVPRVLCEPPRARADTEYCYKILRDAIVRDRQRILDLFRQWDTDNSGAVSKEEFTHGIRRAGFDAHQADLEAMFDDMDEDGSGELEYNELQSKLRQWYAPDGGEVPPVAKYFDL